MTSKEKSKEYRRIFGKLLAGTIDHFNLDMNAFCDEYHWSTSTVRYWKLGLRLPNPDALNSLCQFIYNQNVSKSIINVYKKSIFDLLSTNNLIGYCECINEGTKNPAEIAEKALNTLYALAKGSLSPENKQKFPSCNKTKAVIFDFDGTLTVGKSNKTTWERLWTSLDYDISECQKLHRQFDEKKITHAEWCKLTEDKFVERHLHKNTLIDISDNIKLIDGIEETFQYLQSLDIKIFIVSGSIMFIIQRVLREYLCYIEEIKANRFDFDENGFLTRIVGTQFDFEGKSKYIEKAAEELEISPQDILFVGNSINDRFAYYSGARTLCINPFLTDITNKVVWNDCLQTCRSLTEIKKYLWGYG